MGYVLQVDTGGVASAAADLERVAVELERAGEVLGRVLRSAGAAAGRGALSAAADSAAGQWQQGMGLVAAHGSALARATTETARAYLAVESLHTSGWGAGGGPRWAP